MYARGTARNNYFSQYPLQSHNFVGGGSRGQVIQLHAWITNIQIDKTTRILRIELLHRESWHGRNEMELQRPKPAEMCILLDPHKRSCQQSLWVVSCIGWSACVEMYQKSEELWHSSSRAWISVQLFRSQISPTSTANTQRRDQTPTKQSSGRCAQPSRADSGRRR